ncbi:hypothetical protein RRG08_065736 [Elysia crispata]|uniref:Uncharacterized protein n=1 Tax=Elysia crispata TaxID=231223 RepID=A0AAE1DAX9_9GAST|nr:hypothetical protein RRG08_065736 [Elysia crispata]
MGVGKRILIFCDKSSIFSLCIGFCKKRDDVHSVTEMTFLSGFCYLNLPTRAGSREQLTYLRRQARASHRVTDGQRPQPSLDKWSTGSGAKTGFDGGRPMIRSLSTCLREPSVLASLWNHQAVSPSAFLLQL